LASRVAEVALRLQRRSRQADRVHGITGARLAALDRLVAAGSMPLSELASAEAVSAATMTRIVDGLQEGKLVIRKRSNMDGRVVLVVPTTLGRTLMAAARSRRLRWLESFLTSLSDADRAAVERAVEILARASDQEVPPVS
jgi:DNA-binding MarR family transcriptional regulator